MSNPETLKNTLCCGQPASIMPDKNRDNIDGFGIWCNICGHAIHDPIKENAIKIFLEEAKKPPIQKPPINKQENKGVRNVNNNQQNGLVISKGNIVEQMEMKKRSLSNIMSPIFNGSTSAMERLWNNNTVKYPLSLKTTSWDKIFNTEEGVASVLYEIEEAIIMCAELGKGGDLVPYGKTCKFIPNIDAIKFYLTSGNNAPFLNINIECLYEGDDYETWTEGGSFHIKNKQAKKRIKVVAVAVYGELREEGTVVGEAYDAERLLGKAIEHSDPYKNYMKKFKAYEFQKSEGKVTVDQNGRESFKYYETAKSDESNPYFEKDKQYFINAESNGQLKSDSKGEYASQTVPGRNGKDSWDKKIYRYQIEGGTVATTLYLDELSNPYAGADQPEMLRKTAGKSFLSQFRKTRGAKAAMDEVRTQKGGVNRAMDMSEAQFKTGESEVVD